MDDSIGSLLAQDAEDATERVVYYLSRLLNDVVTRYILIEKLCLSFFHAYIKLEYYLLNTTKSASSARETYEVGYKA